MMITNRTQADVDNAKLIRENYVKTFTTLSKEQIIALERGTMTINTINRIEIKQDELKNLFHDIGYWNTNIRSKLNWAYRDMFTESDYKRILENENILRNAFFVYNSTPPTPNISFHYEDINSLEKILVDLDVMINDVKSNYIECGTYECQEG